MKITRPAAWALLSAAMVTAPGVAVAKKDDAAQAAPAAKQPKVSSGAQKDIVALDKAVKAKDAANIPALVAAAKAAAKTADDKYIVAQLSLSAAIDAQNKPGMLEALQGTVDSGFLSPADQFPFYLNIGKLQYDAKNFAAASTALEKALQIDPKHIETLAALSDTRNQLKHYPEALAALRQAISLKAASGVKADEAWYRRATALAYNNKLPGVTDLSIDWVKAYPSKTSWSDALRIYQQGKAMDPVTAIDVSRLSYTVGAMQSENDYYRYAQAANTKGFPGEAKAVLDAGFAAGVISKASPTFGPLYASVSTKAQGDKASLAAASKTALAAPAAKQAVVIGDAYYGYGDYAQAISLYRAALTKTGVDKDLVNLHLGMALAKSGDKAGAKAALEAVAGAQADTAKLWLTYLALAA